MPSVKQYGPGFLILHKFRIKCMRKILVEHYRFDGNTRKACVVGLRNYRKLAFHRLKMAVELWMEWSRVTCIWYYLMTYMPCDNNNCLLKHTSERLNTPARQWCVRSNKSLLQLVLFGNGISGKFASWVRNLQFILSLTRLLHLLQMQLKSNQDLSKKIRSILAGQNANHTFKIIFQFFSFQFFISLLF